MATLTISNVFQSGEEALASEVNQNFTDVKTFVNTQVVHRDGTNPFTVMPVLPSSASTAVTTAAHAANKAYVDVRDSATKETVGWGLAASGALGASVTGTTLSANIHSNLSVTFTPASSRRYKISAYVQSTLNTTGGVVRLYVYRNASQFAQVARATLFAGQTLLLHGFTVDTPPSGIGVNYALRMDSTAGTVDANGDAVTCRILVEDVGPA